jgi:uncharacterized protein DUF3800
VAAFGWPQLYLRPNLRLCYVDESGGFEPEGSSVSATPLMVIAGVVVDHRDIRPITTEYLRLKQTFYPRALGHAPHLLDYILAEIKSTDLRAQLRSSSRQDRRHAIGYLDKIVSMLERYHARIIGRVWVKAPGAGLDRVSTYTYAIQDLARHFESLLDRSRQPGLMICDSRMHGQDQQVSHGVFTFKHRLMGDQFPHLVESPTFAVSANHAGLQLADLVAGALIFPIACRVYCGSAILPAGSHHYDKLRERYAERLRLLQYLYTDAAGRTRGGFVVSDKRASRSSGYLFRPLQRAAPVGTATP